MANITSLIDWPVSKARPLLSLLMLLAFFFVVEFAYPRLPESDELVFKAAGLHLSKGGAFAAPALEGYLHADPPLEQVYARYPPLYTWLFGQWARLTEFGWAMCVAYDALISSVLACIVYGLADAAAGALLSPLAMRLRTALSLMAALLTLFFRQGARPDELGMALGFANAWWLFVARDSSRPQPGVAGVSGLLAGLMLCTSIGVFLTFIPFLAALWLQRERESMQKILPSLAAAGLVAGLATVLCLSPLFLEHPTFYRQFLSELQSQGVLSELQGQLSATDWVGEILGTVDQALHRSPQRLFILSATLPILFLGMVVNWRNGRSRETLVLFVAPLVGFGLMALLFSSYYYWWFLQPWFLILAMAVTANWLWNRRWRMVGTVAGGWITACLAAASIGPAKDYLVRVTLVPEQRLTPNAEKLRELIPPGATVLTGPGWWALANDRLVYSPKLSDIQDLSRIDYFVGYSNGTGQPGVWAPPENPRYDAMVRESFEVISNTLPAVPLRVFGVRITNSAYGFGTVVMRRVIRPRF